MWSYGQCLGNIKSIVREINTMFSMLVEMLTNDSIFQSTTTALPNLISAIKATAITLCVLFRYVARHRVALLAKLRKHRVCGCSF